MNFWENRKVFTVLYDSKIKGICEKNKLTQMEYEILMFLYQNPHHNTATDIVNSRRLTKSHVSSALKSLEGKEYINRYFETNNSKTIYIELTPLSEPIVKEGLRVQKDFLESLFDGFSEEEKRMCRTFFERICENAEKELRNK